MFNHKGMSRDEFIARLQKALAHISVNLDNLEFIRLTMLDNIIQCPFTLESDKKGLFKNLFAMQYVDIIDDNYSYALASADFVGETIMLKEFMELHRDTLQNLAVVIKKILNEFEK